MGNSTITLESVYDAICAKGIPDPRLNASGFGDTLAVELGNQTRADFICERFNWKFNRAIAEPFYTNSWQQDYPQPAQPKGLIGWGEDCDLIDINNTTRPLPLWNISWRRQLSRTSVSVWRPSQIAWMYNKDMAIGVWPGAGVTYYPLVTTGPQSQNPWMNMTDSNGNILIVTTFGTTGTTAPVLPEDSDEGATVTDGTVVWTCVSPDSQGFRVDKLPNATGPTYKILPYYQIEPPVFTALSDTLDPIPDSYSRAFYRGLECECLIASPNPQDMKRGQDAKAAWLNALANGMKQGDRELNVYGLIPLTNVVERRWDEIGPYTADQPY